MASVRLANEQSLLTASKTAYACPVATEHLLITAKFSFDFLGG